MLNPDSNNKLLLETAILTRVNDLRTLFLETISWQNVNSPVNQLSRIYNTMPGSTHDAPAPEKLYFRQFYERIDFTIRVEAVVNIDKILPEIILLNLTIPHNINTTGVEHFNKIREYIFDFRTFIESRIDIIREFLTIIPPSNEIREKIVTLTNDFVTNGMLPLMKYEERLDDLNAVIQLYIH